MEQVAILAPAERAGIDRERIEELYRQLGPAGAEDVVCRAMVDLAFRMGHIDTLHRNADWAEMRKQTHTTAAVAEQIGMTALARVAGDVVRCIDDGDSVATAATLARLLRLGERSLVAIWDLQDLSL
ncbi:hypothetical protein [Aestuariicoccus sp. MJ-SS9]|uniref:hypothetical protein n=1 Tax=Aestuariicoccus sp. MJ-SS9 TaxID=3079855 RepID=UPI002908E42D|nr:hypothetical protein [Aestuariicoccus sp. MJ-SS9]MDU8910103.1 hypothetical protein [Aestuariicoccus sp. MJ-SS9]